MHPLRRVILTVLLVAATAAPASAQNSKLDNYLRTTLQGSRGAGKVDVIVTVRPDRLRGVAAAINRHGKVTDVRPRANVLLARVPRKHLASLATLPAVERISIDAPVSAFGGLTSRLEAPVDPANSLRSIVGASGLAFTGAGVGVAIIDSGIQPVGDFDTRITAFRDFTRDNSAEGLAVAPYDDFGHGTHVAALVGSSGQLSNGEFRGMAVKARLIGLKVLDGRGRGTTSDVIAAIDFAIRQKDRLGVDIINLSLGHPIYEAAGTDPLVQAVERAVRAGIVVVAAAGNYGRNPLTGEVGYAGISSPGNAPSAITVGATLARGTVDRTDDRIASFSSRGPTWYDGTLKPDVVAPGDSLIGNVGRNASLYKEHPDLVVRPANGPGTYLKLSGTSMAAGVTSGVVALVLEARRHGSLARLETGPRMSANLAKALLQYSAVEVFDGVSAYDPLTQGSGSINAEGAVRLAYAVDTSAPLGTLWIRSFGQPTTSVAGWEWSWSQTVYWGGHEVLGPSILVRELAWDEHIVWGTSTFWATHQDLEHIVWGTNVQWVESSFFDAYIVWGTGVPFDFSLLSDEHIVWGTYFPWDEHIVWGNGLLGLSADEHVVWGNLDEHLVWGNLFEDLDHVVWGNQVSAAGLK